MILGGNSRLDEQSLPVKFSSCIVVTSKLLGFGADLYPA